MLYHHIRLYITACKPVQIFGLTCMLSDPSRLISSKTLVGFPQSVLIIQQQFQTEVTPGYFSYRTGLGRILQIITYREPSCSWAVLGDSVSNKYLVLQGWSDEVLRWLWAEKFSLNEFSFDKLGYSWTSVDWELQQEWTFKGNTEALVCLFNLIWCLEIIIPPRVIVTVIDELYRG